MSETQVISVADVAALARVLLGDQPVELCVTCGKTGPWRCAICGKCAPRALRLLARSYLELASAPELVVHPDERWEGAEAEWGCGPGATKLAETKFASGSQLDATKVASSELLARLRRAAAPREDATRRSERR